MKRAFASATLALALAAPAAFADDARRDDDARAAAGSSMMGGGMPGMGMMMGDRAQNRAAMMDMMGGRGGMMGMMDRPGMGMAMGMGPMAGMLGYGFGPVERVEGRIAFLHAEMKITPEQETAWNAVADALRRNAERSGPPAEAMQAEGALARLEAMEKHLAERLESVRTTRTALAELAPQLDEAQRETLDELLAPAMGPMAAR